MYNQSTDHRNRLLRRADWRFLLGNPWPEKSKCFSGGFLAQAVQAVSSINIPADKDSPGECDLVVATNPDSATLQLAWQSLHSGGNFYSEWFSPLTGGALGICKRLEAAGFTDVVCYWSWPIPNLYSALFWLPLEAPQAVSYFLSSRPRSTDALVRFRNDVLKILWKFFRKTRLLVPICVTARKVDSTLSSTYPTDPDEKIINQTGDCKYGVNSNKFDTIMWTGGKSPINKVILYQFSRGEEIPRQIVKLPRTPEAVPALTHEGNILQALRTMKSKAAAHAPKVLFFHKANGMVALGETTVFGQPLHTVLEPQNALELAMKVTDWLVYLVNDEALRPRTTWWDRLVEPALHDFEYNFKSVLDGAELNNCRAILNRLDDLPSTFEHRDCSPWNLMVTQSGELAVLDWESAEQNGLPAMDLAYFLAYLVFFIDGAMKDGNFIQSYRRARDPKTSTGRLQAACQQRYIECTGLDPAVLHPLRLLTWLIHTRSEVHHLPADAEGAVRPADLRGSLFYRLVLEELAQESVSAQASIH